MCDQEQTQGDQAGEAAAGPLTFRHRPTHALVRYDLLDLVELNDRFNPGDAVFRSIAKTYADVSPATKVFEKIQKLDGSFFYDGCDVVINHSISIIEYARVTRPFEKTRLFNRIFDQITASPNNTLKVTCGVGLIPGNTGWGCTVVMATTADMERWTASMLGRTEMPDSKTAFWPSHLYVCIQMIYLLFVGSSCHVMDDYVMPHFADLQKFYTNSLPTAVNWMGHPLNADFVCQDLARSFNSTIPKIHLSMINIKNRDERMIHINAALIKSIEFKNARHYNDMAVLLDFISLRIANQ
jgi:hypothetical protein